MTGTYQLYLNIYAAVPGHVSNIKGKYMPSVLRVVLYCITVTTGTFDPPTHREIILNLLSHPCSKEKSCPLPFDGSSSHSKMFG